MVFSEQETHCISIISSELQNIASVGSEGAGACQIKYPSGIAITEDDHVLVADCWNDRIQVLTMEGQSLASVGIKGKEPQQLNSQCPLLFIPMGKC